MKKTPHHFYSDVYYQNFYYCQAWKREQVESFFNIKIDPSTRGLTFEVEKGIVIWISSVDLVGCLVHESIHAANFLFRQKGIMASNENDEPLAYFTQWIFENCYKKIKRKK